MNRRTEMIEFAERNRLFESSLLDYGLPSEASTILGTLCGYSLKSCTTEELLTFLSNGGNQDKVAKTLQIVVEKYREIATCTPVEFDKMLIELYHITTESIRLYVLNPQEWSNQFNAGRMP